MEDLNMFNEYIINFNKEDYIDYLICDYGYSVESAKRLADIMYA
jgi:hypothetical protein